MDDSPSSTGGPEPRVPLDRSSPVPLYFQVATRLQELIESGEMPVGGRLENEAELSERLMVSRPTMRRAISYLVERGLLVRKRGAGTRIVHPKVRRPVELTSLYDDLSAGGRRPRTDILAFEVVPAPAAVAEALQIPFGADVTWIERLRYAGDEPLALMQNAVPVDVLPLRRADLAERGLYELLRAAGCVPRTAEQSVGARAATAAEAAQLDESRGAPLLTMVRTAWDDAGRAVEYGSHVYRASRYSFELRLTS